MISDCDIRTTQKLIEKHVLAQMQESYGPSCEVELDTITHKENRVAVTGWVVVPYRDPVPFLTHIARVDGPLDRFL
jgi:hypothetical protein